MHQLYNLTSYDILDKINGFGIWVLYLPEHEHLPELCGVSTAYSSSFIRIHQRTIWEISWVYLYSLMLGSSAAVTNAFFTAVCVDIRDAE